MKPEKLIRKIEKTEDYIAETFDLASMANNKLICNDFIEEGLKKKQYHKQLSDVINEDASLDSVIFNLGLRLMWAMYQVDQLGIDHIELGNECGGCCEHCGKE